MKKPYDSSLVGRFLGSGGEHIVFAYDRDLVIKYSLHFTVTGAGAIEKKRSDYKLADTYFKEYVVPVDIRDWNNGSKAVEIQQRVECRHLYVKDLAMPEVYEQFQDILVRYKKMHEETGKLFDFFGFFGLIGFRLRHSIGNVRITSENKLVIVDFATMHLVPQWYEWPLWLFIEWAKGRQKRLLQKYWLREANSYSVLSSEESSHDFVEGLETDIQRTPEARVGLYAWGGPGTTDLLKVKYHHPRINEKSFNEIYSESFLTNARQVLGVTDLWMSFSWGFSDQTEVRHRQFVREQLSTVKKLGIASYGYVQGLNVVSREFTGQDIFCRSMFGFRLPYSRGRHLICPNNPKARAIVLDRVTAASKEKFSNIFMDNILFGLPPMHFSKQFVSSFGCHCQHCRVAFKKRFGYSLANIRSGTPAFADVLEFRVESTASLIREASAIARGVGKGFGVNLYDPYVHATELFFGYALDRIDPYLDYYLIENHAIALDGSSINNSYLKPLIRKSAKPVFVVSYQHGIGIDSAYTQHAIDLVFSEGNAMGYYPCVKASEFVTDGIWHAMDITKIQSPRLVAPALMTTFPKPLIPVPSKPFSSLAARVLDPFVPLCIEALYQSHILFVLIKRTHLYTQALRRDQRFSLHTTRRSV